MNRINMEVFKKFKPWEGTVEAGFWVNFLGTKTRSHYWKFPDHINALYAKSRYERTSWPGPDDNFFDWLTLLEAVACARDEFVMVALGAGWGRWLVAGAAAVKQYNGILYRLVGVEAEPQHFEWMVRHFKDNSIDMSRCRLIQAAVSDIDGDVWFYVGRADEWYGQSIVPPGTLPFDKAEINTEITVGGHTVRRVKAVTLAQLLQPLKYVDYLHMDIQGAEHSVLTAASRELCEKVKRVHIGTHSSQIEEDLRSFFSNLKWECLYDYPINSKIQIEDKTFAIEDGVQTWLNPKFVALRRSKMSEKSYGGILTRLGIVGELFAFLWKRKLWWLTPMIVVIVLFAVLLIFAQGSAVAPFIYTLF
jgi:FkbM family methyltransferase